MKPLAAVALWLCAFGTLSAAGATTPTGSSPGGVPIPDPMSYDPNVNPWIGSSPLDPITYPADWYIVDLERRALWLRGLVSWPHPWAYVCLWDLETLRPFADGDWIVWGIRNWTSTFVLPDGSFVEEARADTFEVGAATITGGRYTRIRYNRLIYETVWPERSER